MAHKNILRSVLPLLAGVGIVAAGASNVVSCIAPSVAAGEDGQRVIVSTDGGHINDGAFNQDAFAGVQNFLQDAYGMSKEETKNNFVEAGNTDTASLISGYRLSVLKKANTVVLPGFAHANALPQALKFLKKYNVNVILVDSAIPHDTNVVNIQFNSQISGVMAGFDTSYLFGTTYDANGKLKYDTNNDGEIKIGTFAGASNKYGVDNYMWGLLFGMQLYNDMVKDGKINGQKAVQVETANPTDASGASSHSSGNIKDIQTSGNTDPGWYTQSFAQGGAVQSGILSKLIDDGGADVVFPVAGPQILDVLGFKRKSGRAPYVIGVDVDQAAEYGSGNEGRFVTSAIKNIDTAVPEALYRASYADGTGNTLKPSETHPNTESKKYSDDGFNTTDHWLGKQPDPFVNWSIDYTESTAPNGGKYLLKQHYLRLYDPSKTQVAATGAMKDINTFFASLHGGWDDNTGAYKATSDTYMIGSDIYNFAQSLIDHYLDKDNDSNNWTDGELDFFKSASKDTDTPWWKADGTLKTNQ